MLIYIYILCMYLILSILIAMGTELDIEEDLQLGNTRLAKC